MKNVFLFKEEQEFPRLKLICCPKIVLQKLLEEAD